MIKKNKCKFLIFAAFCICVVNLSNVSAAQKACYVCGNSQNGKYVWTDTPGSNCNKQSSLTRESDCLNKNAKCYICSGKYEWTASAGVYCSLQSSITTQNSCLDKNAGCYKCNGEYVWGASLGTTCTRQSTITSPHACKDKNSACYVCGNSQNGKYVWTSNPGSNCNKQSSLTSKSSCENKNPACYACGNSQNGKYVWTNSPGSNCNKMSSITTQAACICEWDTDAKCKSGNNATACYKTSNGCYMPKFTATLMNDGSKYATRTCKLTTGSYCVTNQSEGNFPKPSKSGYVFKGWKSRKDGEVVYYYDQLSSDEIYDARWELIKQDVANESPSTPDPVVVTPSNPVDDPSNPTIVEVTVPKTIKYYCIVYDLDGGQFIDGSTTRKECLRTGQVIGALNTNPIKADNKFVDWYLNDTPFDFNKNIEYYDSYANSNGEISIRAVYEAFENSYDYYCPDGYDVFDPSTQSCYDVMKPDNQITYNYTLYTYKAGSLRCWNYYTGVCEEGSTATNCSTSSKIFIPAGSSNRTLENAYAGDGMITYSSAKNRVGSGKNNADYSIYGYKGGSSDVWVSENTCLVGSACKYDSDWLSTEDCHVRYDTIMYNDTPALLNVYGVEENNETNDNNNDNNESNDADVSTNVKTGDVLIYTAIAGSLGAIGYSIYYFKKKKEIENTL